MNELLKGLVGAELTLLGISPVFPRPSPAAAPAVGSAQSSAVATRAGAAKDDEADAGVKFTQGDYRTAAG